MSHTLLLLSFNFRLVTSWCFTLWYSLCKTPLIVCFPLFLHSRKKAIVQSTKDKGPNSWACRTQVTGLPDASLLTILKQKCRKKEYRILIYLLFIANLWLWAPTVWSPWLPLGGDTVLGAQAYCVLLSASLGIKATFLFPPKNVYFHKGIKFLYSCSFQHCFRKVNRLTCWKEGNLVINADYRSGTAKVEKESKDQREKTFSYFTAA